MFQNRSVLITGASSGIGAALARRFAREGARLILVARRADRLAQLAQELSAPQRPVFITVADLTDAEGYQRVLRTISEREGGVDVLVNNAGIGEYGPFIEKKPADDERMMHLNMDVLVRLTHVVLPAMLERRCGWILNVASMASFQPCPYMGVYGATKAFVLNHSLALREELRGTGVSVTAVCPAGVKTEFFDRGGFDDRRDQFMKIACEPDFVADKALRALKKRQAYVIPGVKNVLTVFIQRFTPLTVVTRIAAKILGPTQKQTPRHPKRR